MLYSSYHNHGTPEYVYTLAEGINLKAALTALGVDVTSAPVALEATATDLYSKIVEDAFGKKASRNYIAPDGTVGAVVDPILIFYENQVENSDPGAVVGASVGEVSQGSGGGKEPGGDTSNSVFYIAVKDTASGGIQYYYYTKAELEACETQQAYTYNDHSVIKTVTL